MSILVVQVLPQGLIFGADRNVTFRRPPLEANGRVEVTVIQGQGQRPKVLKWPNNRALIGYVGAAQIAGIPMDEWLYEFIGRHFDFTSFEDLAKILGGEVEQWRSIDEGNNPAEPLVVHLGGFEEQQGHQVPVVWHLRNASASSGYEDASKEFQLSEAFWEYFPDTPPAQIRLQLDELAKNYDPFWFHQGIDLWTFNDLERFLKGAVRLLCETHPDYKPPQTLADWEKHLKMSILTYGAYFQAFNEPGEQFVGGGVDTVRLPWPE